MYNVPVRLTFVGVWSISGRAPKSLPSVQMVATSNSLQKSLKSIQNSPSILCSSSSLCLVGWVTMLQCLLSLWEKKKWQSIRNSLQFLTEWWKTFTFEEWVLTFQPSCQSTPSCHWRDSSLWPGAKSTLCWFANLQCQWQHSHDVVLIHLCCKHFSWNLPVKWVDLKDGNSQDKIGGRYSFKEESMELANHFSLNFTCGVEFNLKL